MNTGNRCSRPLLFLVLTLFILSGCAKTTVVLLPDPDGKVGHITVTTDVGATDITKAREATVITGRGSIPSSGKVLSEKAIASTFEPVLSSLPEQPLHFILYFKRESTEMTADSKKTVPKILAAIDQRKSEHISVIGHTDTAGDQQFNLQLSQQRASATGRILINKGITSTHIKTTSHGEENPLIKTADNIHEPRNRRVEVVVR